MKKVRFFILSSGGSVMNTRKFWPLDFDPEGEIYENLAWDLPGYKRSRERQRPAAESRRTKKSQRA